MNPTAPDQPIPPKGVLAIIGGSASHLPFIETAHRMGYRTLVFDLSPTAPARKVAHQFHAISTYDTAKVLDVCRKVHNTTRIAGVLTYSSATPALRTCATIGTDLNLPTHTHEAIDNTTQKSRMKNILREVNAPIPAGISTSEFGRAREFLNASNGPWIVKPASDGLGSVGVNLVQTPTDLQKYFEFAKSHSSDGTILIEEYCPGIEYSVDGIVDRDSVHILAISRKYSLGPTANFVMSGFSTKDAAALEHDQQRSIQQTIHQSVRALGLRSSPFSADIIVSSSKIVILEVGVLLDAKIDRMLYTAGLDVYEALVRVATGEQLDPERFQLPQNVSMKFLFAEQPGSFQRPPSSVGLGPTLRVEWERNSGDPVVPPNSIADVLGWVISTENRGFHEINMVANRIYSDGVYTVNEASVT